MIVVVNKEIQKEELNKIKDIAIEYNCDIEKINSVNGTAYGLFGDVSKIDKKRLLEINNVKKVTILTVPFKRASRQMHSEDTVVIVKGIKIGGNNPVVFISGPCSVETLETVNEIACKIKEAGAVFLRGGAYKPRTSPYSFQGLGSKGIKTLSIASEKSGLPIVSELTNIKNLPEFLDKVDIIQIGARNMQNFDLLKAVGKTKKPIMLKRGLSNTIEEWLLSAEYILSEGNPNVILCERGIRTFEKYTRNTLDLSVIPIVKRLSHLPIIIDPSHATGDRSLIKPMTLAAVAAGCDGVMIESHIDPDNAWSDAAQTITINELEDIISCSKLVSKAVGHKI